MTGSSEAAGRVSGRARSGQTAVPETKMFSSGFESQAASGLAPGNYDFTLTLGSQLEGVSVQVESGDTWGQVLARTVDAVNTTGLPVRADVVYNNAAFQQNPDMAGVGSVLTFSVNPNRADQNIQATDTSGGLLRALGMAAAPNAVGTAQTGPYDVTVLSTAKPTTFASTPADPRSAAATTLGLAQGRHDLAYASGLGQSEAATYISKVYDPTQASTLAPGAYAFTATTDGETRAHSVTIGAGWTWGDVLRSVGAEINGQYAQVNQADSTTVAPSSTFSQSGVSARVEAWPIPDATRQNIYTNGESLQVSGQAQGNFSLADTSGGLLGALGLTTQLTGTPVSFTVEANDTVNDAYVSLGVALGDAAGLRLNADRMSRAIPSTVTPGKDLYHQGLILSLVQQDQLIGQRQGLSDGSGGMLGNTSLSGSGLNATANPGQDGAVIINGVTRVSENNTFSQDKGRVLFDVQENTGESLPLRVTEGMGQLERSLAQVTGAYNDLMGFIAKNADQLSATLKETLQKPLAERSGALAPFGVALTGRQGLAWTNLDQFWRGTYADTATAKALFADRAAGLVPAWNRAVDAVRAAGLDGWLKPVSSFERNRPTLTSEFELEQKHRLVNLLG